MTRSRRPEITLLLAILGLPAAARAQSLDSLVTRMARMSAITGMEDAMADTLLTLLPGAVKDRAGNVVLTRGRGAPTRIVACGMDEIGYVVGSVSEEGYLSLRRVGATNVGPLYDQFLEGQRITVFGRQGPVPGVVGVKSTHLTRGRTADGDPPFALDNAWVDVGASNAADIDRLGIQPLAPVTRAKKVQRYGPDGSLIAGPWIAQRASCAAVLSAALRTERSFGTTIFAFTARWHFNRDGLAFITSANPGAAVTIAELQPRYAHTPAETVSMNDVRQLEATLMNASGAR